MLTHIVYSEEADLKAPAEGNIQNHEVYCNALNGRIYKATKCEMATSSILHTKAAPALGQRAEARAQEAAWRKNIVDDVDVFKLFRFENLKGPLYKGSESESVTKFKADLNAAKFTHEEKQNIVRAFERYNKLGKEAVIYKKNVAAEPIRMPVQQLPQSSNLSNG